MNKFKIEITIRDKTYIEDFETTMAAQELVRDIQQYNSFYKEEPDVITIYNFDNVDVLKIIQE